MHLKQKLTFMAFGSILTLAGYLLATPTRDVTAQSETDKATVFDEIVCRKLKIVDENGKTHIVIGADLLGGQISVNHHNGKNAVSIRAFPTGGYISVSNRDGKQGVAINAFSSGGYMIVNNADGERAVTIGTSDDKRGFVSVDSKSTKGLIQLTANEYGGAMNIYGKTDNKTRVVIGINERGHGTINTWDKNGYRILP